MTNKAQEDEKTSKKNSATNDAQAKEEKKSDINNKNEDAENTASQKDAKGDEKKSDKSKGKQKQKNKTDSKEEIIEELEEQIQTLNDKHLRLQAEFDNFRKRTFKERMELIKHAGEDTLKDLLPIIDDIDRAIINNESAKDLQAVKEGISLIQIKFQDFLKSKGLTEINAMHSEFDTDLHEAVTKIPAPDENLKGKIVDVIQKGYILNEKVIRFAKVIIGE